ncbi:unnamed protein product [Cylicocyclus nassatus]|uniref:Nucleoporin Nup54 alpha-helical domain-containing protein n=1 Tax=Cylicocyclus nassatus TaxID=53992 RepID=A0AA36GZC9_CYLNA|nr:unnamed protein product [Cylicocyclus nassatus]
MSLFGGKPLFGSTSTATTSSGFTFGATTTTTSAPSLFGSTSTATPASKPLFGSVPQSGTTTSLFGTTTTTSGGLFGSKTATTTTASGGLFGSSASGGLFSKPTTGFGSTAGTGLFGSKPLGGGLFGAAATAQPATETKQTVQGILQESDALVRSLTKVELFGDERDEMVAKLNQLAAALGTGCGYYKDGQQPVQYTQGGPFHRIKAIGYNRPSEYADSDGIVALVVKAPFTDYQTSEQKQKFVDALFVILGSKPTIHAHIESIKALPDNHTEICVYVTEKFRGRISSKELAQYFNQATQKQQLESQLKVDKEKIISRVHMDKQQKELYLKDPPTGFDASLWAQAVRENPDPERLLPYPIRGFEQLRMRQKAQIENIRIENAVVEAMKTRIGRLEANVTAAAVQLAQQKVIQQRLSHRLLRVLSMQLMSQRFTQGIDATEESMQSALESINARLNAPHQIKERIAEISETLRVEDANLRNSLSKDTGFIDESDALSLKKYLDRCQDVNGSCCGRLVSHVITKQSSNIATMTLDDDGRKAEKRARSEAQRLESIRAKKELEKQRQAIMSKALREVDQKSKRVVFEDSDEDEEQPSTSSHAISSSKHPKLFEESSSEESDDNNEQLNIVNRHVGKKGEKLMKLEARFNSDSRFHLDEKFVSSGSEDEETDEVAQERSKNLELLSKVLGSTVKPKKKTLKTSSKDVASGQLGFRPFTRFDPFNEEHVKWVQKEEASAKDGEEKKSSGESADESEEEKDEKVTNGVVSTGIHYEMQPEFAEELKARLAGQASADDAKNDGGFSFLAMMGRAEPVAEDKQESKVKGKEEDIVVNKKLNKILGHDDEDVGQNDSIYGKLGLQKLSLAAPVTKFFVTGDEPHLQSLVSNFKRTQSLEKIVPRWANQRDVFAKNYKHLRKAALKEAKQKLLRENGQTSSKNVDRNGRRFPKKRKNEEVA